MGSTLARYRILERVAAGGMGEVYRAEDTLLRRFVAVKVLSPMTLADREATERIYQEALAASALSHPNICVVYDFGTDRERSFMVMELLEGQTLKELLSQSRLPIEQTLSVARQTAEGLHAAHEKKIIHRDVKPANIFVTQRGHVKILDFGIAKRVASALDDMMTGAVVMDLTQDGSTFGTIAYMSTEQLRGEQIDVRTDIFSFGSVLYEMLTGGPPFRADTSALVFDAILHRNPEAPSAINAQVPPALDRIVAKALEKDRARRYGTFQEVVADLDLLAHSTESVARPLTATASLPTPRPVRPRKRESTAPRSIDSLAVLPFLNVNKDADTDYLTDGITETIINKLSQLRALRVIPRTTVFRYKNAAIDPKVVSAELKVRAILMGRVLQRGGRLIVNTELVDAKKEAQLWGEQYNRAVSDIFELQEHIAAEIARSLQLTLSGEDHQKLVRRDTRDPAAYQSYLKGRFYWNKRSTEGLLQAIKHFQMAIEQDPEYAPAYVGLSDTFNVLGYYNGRRPLDTYPCAKAAVARAIEIDDSIGEAYASLGFATLFFDRDWDGAERAFLEAIRLNPRYASAHQWYGWWLMVMGRFDEMVAAMRRALELEPLSLIINDHYGYSLALAGRSAEAVQQLKATLDLDPGFALTHQQLGFVCLRDGRPEAAVEHLEAAVRASSGRVGTALLGCAAGLAGRRELACEMLHGLSGGAERRFVSPLDFALVHAGLNEIDEVFDALGRAIDERVSDLVRLNLFPWPHAVRDDRRFEAVLRQVGIGGVR